MSECDTEDEIDPNMTPISLTPVSKLNKRNKKPHLAEKCRTHFKISLVL